MSNKPPEDFGNDEISRAMSNAATFTDNINALIADNTNLRAERDALAERLRQSTEMREIVGELRKILDRGCYAYDVKELLRRLDESQ